MEKLRVIKMQDTDVRLIIPGDVEVFCLAKKADSDMEVCKSGSTLGIEFSFPLTAFIYELSELPKELAKEAGCFAIMEIAKAAGLGIIEMKSGNEFAEELAKSLKDIFKEGGEQE